MKRSIKKRLTASMLCLTVGSLAVLGLVCAATMVALWGTTLNAFHQMGEQAAQDSGDMLQTQVLEALSSTAYDMALLTDEKLHGIEQDAYVLAGLMTELHSKPKGDPPHSLISSEQGTLLYPATVTDDVQEEAELICGVAGTLRQLAQVTPSITACYAATQSGLLLMYDKGGAKPDDTFDPRTREWYSRCAQAGTLQWVGPFEDAMGRGLGMVCSLPFYDSNGKLWGVVGIGILLEDINSMVLDTRIGKTGYAFITDRRGQMIISRDIKTAKSGEIVRPKLSASSNGEMAVVIEDIANGRQGTAHTMLDGQEVFLGYCPLKNLKWQMVTVASVETTLAPVEAGRHAIRELAGRTQQTAASRLLPMVTLFGVLVAAAVAVSTGSGIALSRKITEPIRRLACSVAQLNKGFVVCSEVIRTGDEIEELSTAFCSMTRQLDTHMRSLAQVTAEKERIATELDVAARIQTGMLPCIFPAFPDLPQIDLYAEMTPALEVGGDFYDFFLIGQARLGVVIADVSGKGVPSALFMVIAKTLLQNHAQLGCSPAQVFEQCNQQLCRNNEAGLFVTAFMGVLELDTGLFSFCCAGHNPPLLLRNNKWEWLDTPVDFVLAGLPNARFEQREVTLLSGDALFMYTDGVTEAMDAAGTMYTEDRLLDCICKLPKTASALDIADCVRSDVAAHTHGVSRSDDTTMLALVWKGDGSS